MAKPMIKAVCIVRARGRPEEPYVRYVLGKGIVSGNDTATIADAR